MNTDLSNKVGLNAAVGGAELCAWQSARGVVWVQTRNPKHARRMGQRGDSRLVARGVAGGYLKTFEFQRSLKWAMRLMKRYMSDVAATNAAWNDANCPTASRKCPVGRGQAGGLAAQAAA